MRKTYTVVIIATLSLTVCIGAGLLLSACGSVADRRREAGAPIRVFAEPKPNV